VTDDSSYQFGPFELLVRRQLLIHAGSPVRIGSRALAILTLLVERAGDVVAKENLISAVWPNTFVDESNLKVNIANLRRALASDVSRQDYILTVSGRGYRFVAPVHRISVNTRGLPSNVKLIGRADDVTAVQDQLSKRPVVTIVGTGGIGKTALAMAVAYDVVRRYSDGLSFIDLAKISAAQFIPAAFGFALGVPVGGEDPIEGLIHALEGRRKLLLVDNCEHLLPTVAGVIDRLSNSLDGVRILATSREPLRVRSEHVHRLASLETGPRDSLTASEARFYPAMNLFVTRVHERTKYGFTDADALLVAEICRRLDGIPLAIELAAARIGPLTPARLLQMLGEHSRDLGYGSPRAPLRQQTLRAALDWSYSLLSDPEATIARALSVFAGTFNIEAALAIAPTGIPPEMAVDVLLSLAAKSFIVIDWQEGVVAYRLLETTRSYLLERLHFAGEEDDARQRHAIFVCTLLESASHPSAMSAPRVWGPKFGRWLDDVRLALGWVMIDPTRSGLLIRLTLAAHPLWDYFSFNDECRRQAGRAIAALDTAGLVGAETEMRLQAMFAASSSYTVGMAPATVSAMRRSLELAIRLENKEYELRALWQLGVYLIYSGQPDRAVEHLEKLKEVAAAAKNSSALLDGERLLGTAETFAGHLLRARRRLDELAANARPHKESDRLVRFHLDRDIAVQAARATVLWLLGRPGEAAAIGKAGVASAIEISHELSLCNMVVNGSCPVALWSGNWADAERDLTTLEERFERHSSIIFRPLAKHLRAELMFARRQSGALEALQDAIAGLDVTHHATRMPIRLGVLAEAQATYGRVTEAARTIAGAITRAQTQKERWCLPELLRIQASIGAAQGRLHDAESLLLNAMTLADELGAASWRLRAANQLAQMRLEQGQAKDAVQILGPIFDRFIKDFETIDLKHARALLSICASSKGGVKRRSRTAALPVRRKPTPPRRSSGASH
jgi:predicted ATPase